MVQCSSTSFRAVILSPEITNDGRSMELIDSEVAAQGAQGVRWENAYSFLWATDKITSIGRRRTLCLGEGRADRRRVVSIVYVVKAKLTADT